MNSRIITLSLALGLLGGITELSALPQKPTRKVQTYDLPLRVHAYE